MLEWASVYWLVAAFAAAPLIWWLHRLRRPVSRQRVSALFLWENSAADEPPGVRPRTADSIWWLRALIAIGLCVAAAGPMWSSDAGRGLEVWLDDSVSMRAREAEGARYERAIDALINALTKSDAETVTVHSLTRTGKKMALTPPVGDTGRRRLREWFQGRSAPLGLPPPVTMNPQADHWLVTDGATTGLASWLKGTTIRRVISVGDETENVSLTGFSLRRSLRDPDAILGRVEFRNFGDRDAERELLVRVGNRTLSRKRVAIPAGDRGARFFRLESSGAARLNVKLLPEDAVSEDDILNLEHNHLADVPIRIVGDCGFPLRTAINAHPAVYSVGDRDAKATVALLVYCGRQRPVAEGPVIWVRRSGEIAMVPAAPNWSASAGPLREINFQPTWLRQVTVSGKKTGMKPLLSVGVRSLILISDTSPPMVEVRLDLTDPALTGRPEFPALVAGLIEVALGYSPLQAYAAVDHPSSAGVIRPRKLVAPIARSSTGRGGQRWDLTPYLIAVALGLLLLDTILGMRRRRRPAREVSVG